MTDLLPLIRMSGHAVRAEPLATLPASAASGPVPRIQQVAQVPGGDVPGGEVLAVLDTRGLVWGLSAEGVVSDAPLIDLRGAGGFAEPGPEAGLRSVAFHPDFAREGAPGYGKVYLAYSASVASRPDGVRLFGSDRPALFDDVVAEFDADPASLVIDPGSARELFRVEQPFGNHNFGQMAFDGGLAPGDPGYGQLYLGIGDGGGGNDPLDAAEELSLIYGKVLRIDPLADGDEPYAVPAGNPFAGTAGALPEVYAYGFRNPQALGFDEGRLFASDIGQSAVEEVNLVRRGASHGWDDREGTFANEDGVVGLLPEGDAALGYQYPVIQYGHGEAAGSVAVAGGLVYRGNQMPGLDGAYLSTDFPSGRLFVLPGDLLDAATADGLVGASEAYLPGEVRLVDADGRETSFAEVAGNASGRVDLRLAELPSGEVIAFSKQDGTIYRLTPADGVLLEGADEAEVLAGSLGADTILGGAGDDVIYGDLAPEAVYDDGF